MQSMATLEGLQLALEEDTIKCSRCESDTPESEMVTVHAWLVCGNCYDEI